MAFFVDTAASPSFVSCPYNASHQIKPSRLIYHLARCSKKASSQGYLVCPFNAKHRLLPHQMLDHISECTSMIPGVITETDIEEYKKYVEDAKNQGLVEPEVWIEEGSMGEQSSEVKEKKEKEGQEDEEEECWD